MPVFIISTRRARQVRREWRMIERRTDRHKCAAAMRIARHMYNCGLTGTDDD